MIKSAAYAGLFAILSLPLAAQNPHPELWYWHHSLLNSPQAVASSEALIDRAAAAGYTGVAFWDVSSEFINSSFWPAGAAGYFQQAMNYAKSKGMQVMVTAAPFGYSNDVLENNPSWAEAQRVVGTQFQVDPSGTRLQLLNSFPGLLNPGFELGQVDWFSLGDAGLGVDTTVAHTGMASALISNAPADARLKQGFTLQPWRQYHLQLFYKSQNFQGFSMLAVFDANNFNIVRLNPTINAGGTQGWTELDYTFNSQDTTQAYLYLGVWGGNSGQLWFDDIQIAETDFVYLDRGRAGTPLKVYNPGNPTSVYQEGVDYSYISDPQMTASMTPFTDTYHAPPTVTLPAGTHLSPGQVVAIDSYAVFPIPGALGVNMCFTEPGVLNWLNQNANALAGVLPQGGSVLLSYDEIRQMDSCFTCKAKNMTPGQLLAWSVGQSVSTYQSAMPASPLYVWGDMFDPYQNALSNYYYVEGDLSGSWTGVPANVTIMNWNLNNLTNSLTWFSGSNPSQPLAHQQIIAGYYDSGNGTTAAQSELAQASGIRGVMGLMYTTWEDDYSQLENFASAVQANWGAYLGSVSSSVPPVPVQIIAKSSGSCLDVRGISLAIGAQVQQWSCWGGPNQLWQVLPVGDGSFELLSVNSGMSLNVGSNSMQDGGLIIQWPYVNTTNEHWMITPTSDGFKTIVAQSSGMCLDVTGGPAATWNGDPIQQWACWGGDNQKWSLVPLN